jgi:hypothetical protein
MHCIHCGKQIQDDASFCPCCGKAATKVAKTDEGSFVEQCQITYYWKEIRMRCELYFWADAIGKSGKYNAGESPHFIFGSFLFNDYADMPTGGSPSEMTKSSNAHRALVKQLLDDGWEPLAERGEQWWELRFRRKVKI